MRRSLVQATTPGAGISLKPVHYRAILETAPEVAFFEVHAENYMGAGGAPHRHLEAVRARYSLSVHGVGLSIGSDEDLDARHVQRLATLVNRYEPQLVSEHLAWSTHQGRYLNDLLPLPYTPATLARVCAHVDEVQWALGRQILIENPSVYVRLTASTLPESEFLEQLAQRTGCGLLLDVTNGLVSATNLGADPFAWLEGFPMSHVRQIHLAGFTRCPTSEDGEHQMLLDEHGSEVCAAVWRLYARALAHCGPVPTLIEWDNHIPELPVLLAQAAQAEALLQAEHLRRRVPQVAEDAPRARLG